MTWALCLHYGEIKFGAICPCPKCDVQSSGDMNLDIALSDHNLSRDTLEGLGSVVSAIHGVSDDDELCFWTFIRYISVNHSTILGVDLEPEVQAKCDDLLERLDTPVVDVRPSAQGLRKISGAQEMQRRWWQFWKPRHADSQKDCEPPDD